MKQTKVALILSIAMMICSNSAIAKTKKHSVKSAKRTKPIIVAVIDTGISDELKDANFLCKFGHKDFTGLGLNDTHGHGTHISGLIDQYAKGLRLGKETTIAGLLNTKANYCQVILKFYNPSRFQESGNPKREVEALKYAINIHVDIINFSGGGLAPDPEENELIKKALDMGIKVVVAAGNERTEISDPKQRCYWPACSDPRLFVVGNLSHEGGGRAPSSNYGSIVNTWEIGTDLLSLADLTHGAYMTGTSQATAVKTGKIVHEMLSH